MGVGAVWYDIALVVKRGCPFGLYDPLSAPFRCRSLPTSNAAHRSCTAHTHRCTRCFRTSVAGCSVLVSVHVPCDLIRWFWLFYVLNFIFLHRCSISFVLRFQFFRVYSVKLFVKVRMCFRLFLNVCWWLLFVIWPTTRGQFLYIYVLKFYDTSVFENVIR